jgi:hypothetical protein
MQSRVKKRKPDQQIEIPISEPAPVHVDVAIDVRASRPAPLEAASAHPPLSDAWVEETVRLANEQREDIDGRIASGMIPPPPSVLNADAWSTWYVEHLACARPDHRFFVRQRGSKYCSNCSSCSASMLVAP